MTADLNPFYRGTPTLRTLLIRLWTCPLFGAMIVGFPLTVRRFGSIFVRQRLFELGRGFCECPRLPAIPDSMLCPDVTASYAASFRPLRPLSSRLPSLIRLTVARPLGGPHGHCGPVQDSTSVVGVMTPSSMLGIRFKGAGRPLHFNVGPCSLRFKQGVLSRGARSPPSICCILRW